MTTETVYILLFVVATAVAILSRRLSVPYTIALVLAGLVLGALQVLHPPTLTRDLLFTLFLPGLLFEAAFHLEFDAFRRNWIPITGLAVPGVVLSLVVTAALLYPLAQNISPVARFTWLDALLFGAIVASTDPIAVVALLKSLGVPRRLSTLLEGESLLNDGTSVVVFSLILGIALGTRTAGGAVVTDFARVVGGGIVVGIALGMGLSEVIRRVDDAMIEITLTTIAAYGSFLAADNLGYSGVIATVVAGLVCGNYGARKGMSASSRLATESFWEYVSFAFNSMVFLLIGFELQLHQLVASWLPITLAYVAVTAGRAIVLTGVSATLAGSSLRIPPRWTVVLSWGGLRGGLSMVLALGLPQAFPQRDFLITVTFGVVFLSILIQGFTMTPLVRRLGLVEEADTARSYERSRGRLFISRGALEELERMIGGGFADEDALAPLRGEYDRRIQEASREVAELRHGGAQIEARSRRSAHLRLLASERRLASEAYGRGLVGTEVYHELVADIDARALELETHGEPGPAKDAEHAPESDHISPGRTMHSPTETTMKLDPMAGKPAPPDMLVNVPRLLTAYFEEVPDPSVPGQRVSFGTSGHRGSASGSTFNEWHILAITQAVCDYRKGQGIDGPLFLGIDTHALSEPASASTLEVLAANGVEVMVARDGEYTPTPAVSLAILTHNRDHERGRADGIVVTPSHNPPEEGGFKYNPPHGGPADEDVTDWIESSANAFLEADLKGVKRIPYQQARAADTTHEHDFLSAYVRALGDVLDMEAIREAGLRLGVDPLGGAGVHYWPRIAERYGLDLTVVNDAVDPTFRFMTVDWDGRIRMDPSSRYAMRGLIDLADRFDIAFACDTDHDRHGIVTRSAGLLPPNHYLAAAVHYLFRNRPKWSAGAAVGKTLVSSSMIDRVAEKLGRPVVEVPVGFKWFVTGLLDGSLAFGGEESAGASFSRLDGSVWTTDKDGIAAALLSAEITAREGRDPGEIYEALAAEFGEPVYARIEARATREQKERLRKLSADEVLERELAGEEIETILTRAPGNGAPIGGLKVTAGSGWFAARPSGTEDLYKIYAESFKGEEHLGRILDEAQAIVARALRAPSP